MSVNLHANLKDDHSYKLIQLSPDLLKVLEDKDSRNGLKFKTVSRKTDNSQKDVNNDVVLCSNNKTWLMRQMNHSNTVMLMKEFLPDEMPNLEKIPLFGTNSLPNKDYLGFARTTFEYETKLIENPLINLDGIPVYNGETKLSQQCDENSIKDKESILKNSLCSSEQFEARWRAIGGCCIDGYVCLLSSEFLSKVLHIVLMSIMAESLDFRNLTINDVYKAVNKDIDDGSANDENKLYSMEAIETVIKKFGMPIEYEGDNSTDEIWKLNMKEIVTWYGIKALKKYVSRKSMSQDEFLINWKSLFPPYFPSEMDIELLRGWYYKPTTNTIQYVSKDVLPMDIKDRFKMLFKLQSQWEQDEIIPFIQELNTNNIKFDNFIMKFARRKRVGKKYIISSRN